MKERINLLFFKDINRFLGCEKFEYMVIEDNEIFTIKPLPPVFNEYSSILRSYLAYDYDNLSEMHKNLYKNQYKSFCLLEKNKYKKDVKIYQFKKNNV